MNQEQLQKLVQEGESQYLEFKKSTSQIKAAFETVCAFLNSKGGIILFGVNDNGKLIGQNVTDSTRQELAKEIKKIEPYPQIETHYISIENSLMIIVLEVPSGKHIPYIYDGRPFERNQSTTGRMTQHRYEQLMIYRSHLNHSWEEFLTDEYTIDDLDHEEIHKTVEEGIQKNRIGVEGAHYSIEQILKNFQLIKNGKLTHAAIVLFAKDPIKIFSRCEIKMARFRGRDKLRDFIDNQSERGNVFQLIAIAHHFVSRHLPIASFFEPGKLQRIDQPAIPQLALREAITNAFCHRDYSIKSAVTSLSIYDDRLEIWNPGELPPELKVEQLKEPHNSCQRNELIAHVFYKRGWIEKWGTGTTRMVEYCNKNKTPEPEFSECSNGFSVVFPFKEPMNSVVFKSIITNENQLTPRQKEILNLFNAKESMSANEIRNKLQMSPAPRTLRDDLMFLKKNGLIDSTGHAIKTIWFKK